MRFAGPARTISRGSISTCRWATDRRHRPERQRQIVSRLRHDLRRGPAPLRRDVQPVHAAIPRPHGQAAGGRNPRHPARHRHRAIEPGQEHALDRRHDDGDQRLPEAALAAGGAGVLPELRTRDPARNGEIDRRSGDRQRSAASSQRELRDAGEQETRARDTFITFWVAVPAKTEPRRFFRFPPAQGYLRVWIERRSRARR